MIHGISSPEQDFGAWSISRVEHEVRAQGQMVDLKADFYVEKMAIAGDKLTMETIGFPKCESFHVGLSSCGILVRMVWSGCSEISLRQIGKLILEEEDSHYGILGIRLMGRSDIGLLSFVIDGDWFEVSIQCRAFSVESESLPYP